MGTKKLAMETRKALEKALPVKVLRIYPGPKAHLKIELEHEGRVHTFTAACSPRDADVAVETSVRHIKRCLSGVYK